MAEPRSILLPDPLSSKRAGPALRGSAQEIHRAQALKFKEPISQWNGSELTNIQLREALNRTLAEHAHFGYIRSGSKLPHSHSRRKDPVHSFATPEGFEGFIRPNGARWLAAPTVPSSGNWSVIPKLGSRLYIFDFDVAKTKSWGGREIATSPRDRYREARRSISQLGAILDVDLTKTYAQLSPSGGVHIFVLLPEDVDPRELPSSKFSDGMRVLAGVDRQNWSTELQGDIRSGASNGFILMAGSELKEGHGEDQEIGRYSPLVADEQWSDFKDYLSARKLRLLTLPEHAVNRLREARALDLELKAKHSRSANASRGSFKATTRTRSKTLVNPARYSRLLSRLRETPRLSHHGARAQIYRAMSCCNSFEAIASLCRESGYDRDSYGNRELSDGELFGDLRAMDKRGITSSRCGSHCRSIGAESTGEPSLRAQELERLTAAVLEEASLENSNEAPERLALRATLEARATLWKRSQRAQPRGIYGKRKPLGFDYNVLTEEIIGADRFTALLRGDSRFVAGYRLRALELILGYFAPLFSAGASSVLGSVEELTELFGWTPSQLREALRFLRSSKILKLSKRQTTGMSSLYSPGESHFFDEELSRKLKRAWGRSLVKTSAGEQAFLGGFFDFQRGAVLRPDGSSYSDSYLREVSSSFQSLLVELSLPLGSVSRVSGAVVARYLRKSLERYTEIAELRALEAQGDLRELQQADAGSQAAPVAAEPIEAHWTLESRGISPTKSRNIREHRSVRRLSRGIRGSQRSGTGRSPPRSSELEEP